ncbi:MAG: M42 family peptidase [Clostridia bacterium]|nr:M42 family peptidase [Clostridia bacterium]
MTDLLKKLTSIPAVSGNEKEIREFILKEVSPFAECRVDKNGNIICFKKGKKSAVKKVMLDAHMDEVGIIASSYTSDGFIKFQMVGSIETSVMLCRSVVFENGVRGVVGLKPVHLSGKDEREKLPGADSLYIDIGASNEQEAKELVSLGSTAVFESDFSNLSDNTVKARAIDDRAGCAILITLLKEEAEYDFYGVFSVLEEVGARGARTAAYEIDPDAAIILEATTAADLHGVLKENTICKLGDGPAISFMDRSTLYDRRLYDEALSCSVKCQVKAMVAGGNNAGAIHLTRSGIPSLAISIPCRYIHSPSCVANTKDMNNALLLSKEMLKRIASGKIL